ncbi:hypothetical protein HYH03_008359 [Edaphochlamys debaryana]|uniref:Uncharacterized protein n=1 Tax=Edaphochlamys debaryana TaxID=47281 RepID=A0A835Y0L1_9CHLO|nr:hypothetical protein HYH03_008359 [Edaphochlamys debaryana]|eukprot:KAG2493545.1 hypothetical protein HYH03_008359 [Edaphochlamys debaryana]
MFVGLDGSGKSTLVSTLLRDAIDRASAAAAAAGIADPRASTSSAIRSVPPSRAQTGHPLSALSATSPGPAPGLLAASPAGTATGMQTGGAGPAPSPAPATAPAAATTAAVGAAKALWSVASRIQIPAAGPSEGGTLYHLPDCGGLRSECVLMDTPGSLTLRRRYRFLDGLRLATAVVLAVDAADEERFPVLRDFFVRCVLPEIARRHLPLLLVATKRDLCDWGEAEQVAMELDLAIRMAHVAAPWACAHVDARDVAALREPLGWLLAQSHIADHLWHSWPASAPLLLHYQQANARYAVALAGRQAVELFSPGGEGEGGPSSADAGGAGAGAGVAPAAAPYRVTAAAGHPADAVGSPPLVAVAAHAAAGGGGGAGEIHSEARDAEDPTRV